MKLRYRVSPAQLRDTFTELRRCGEGRRECQVLWLSPWADPGNITQIVHPIHDATGASFVLDGHGLTELWHKLGREKLGVRVQVHTHPATAFHSMEDNEWPLIHIPGFLSLVIPSFAQGKIALGDVYLTELNESGNWTEVKVEDRIELTHEGG